MIVLLAILALLVAAMALDLWVIHRGIQIQTPYGTYWVRKGSWVNWLTGSDGTSLGVTTHLRHGLTQFRPPFLCHEIGHLVDQRGRFTPLWTAKYLVSKQFRDEAEQFADNFSGLHSLEPWVAQARLKILG